MTRSRVFATTALAGILVASSASAITSASPKTIQELRQSFQKDAYEVVLTTALSGAIDNPANCPNSTIADMETVPSITQAQKDLMNRTLLSAYLAGKNVQLQIKESACSANNRPIFVGVRL